MPDGAAGQALRIPDPAELLPAARKDLLEIIRRDHPETYAAAYRTMTGNRDGLDRVADAVRSARGGPPPTQIRGFA